MRFAESMSEHSLDARRLLCPLPVIRVQNAIKNLQPGDQLLVVATDPGVKADIPAWCRVHGHQLLSVEDNAATREVWLRILVC